MEDLMVQDRKKFTGGKQADASKKLDNRKTQQVADKDTARPGHMKDQNLSRDKDIASKRDTGPRK